MIKNQLDMFIKTDIPCKCKVKHIFTEYEAKDTINTLNRIKNLITEMGWELSVNYHHHLGKLDNSCNAWNTENTQYLILRAELQESLASVTIPLWRRDRYE